MKWGCGWWPEATRVVDEVAQGEVAFGATDADDVAAAAAANRCVFFPCLLTKCVDLGS